MRLGTVFWITGLSGAGKTTVSSLLYRRMKPELPNLVLLDGDALRRICSSDLGYSNEDRRKLAHRFGRLCKELSDQGIHVIIATMSLFEDCREWNRANIQNYKEVYLRVPLEVLVQRDSKNLYKRALKGEETNVVGVDIPFDEPKRPDVVIDNHGSTKPEVVLDRLMKELNVAQLFS